MKLIYIFLILEHPGPSQRLKKTIDIDTHKVLLKESGVNLTLTIVDTPGTYIGFELTSNQLRIDFESTLNRL